jgi:hypothetical protein
MLGGYGNGPGIEGAAAGTGKIAGSTDDVRLTTKDGRRGSGCLPTAPKRVAGLREAAAAAAAAATGAAAEPWELRSS